MKYEHKFDTRIGILLFTYTKILPVHKERVSCFSSTDFNAFPLDMQDTFQDVSSTIIFILSLAKQDLFHPSK